jgi:DNA-directed RNA polymerase sigma subunit (sigma70/sigma32)
MMHTDLAQLAAQPISSDLDAAVSRYLALALSDAEAAVLRLMFGLDGTPCSIAAVAARLGIRPAVAQRLRTRAMRALRRAALAGEDATT